MSILARYKKPGGFRQLIRLIETSQPVKQDKLIEVVANEDPRWADLIREKKITVEMVLSWNDEFLVTIFEAMNTQHCAVVLKNIDNSYHKKFINIFKPEKYREINELVLNGDDPTGPQIMGAHFHLLETVRFLDEERKIILSQIDPKLDISDAA